MKNIFNISIGLATIVVFLVASSCSQETLDKINTNPNQPLDVSVNLILPAVQTNLAYEIVGGDMSLYAAVWVQLNTGVHAQMHDADRFIYSSNLVQNDWNASYDDVLKNTRIMIEKARAENSWAYVAIGQILFAYDASLVTDSWGKIPYSEALQGSDNLKPKYDDQQAIYTGPGGILNLLDSAIINLGKESAATPSDDDLIYGGNMGKWMKSAYGLKAKLITRLRNTDAYDAQKVLDAVKMSFNSPGDAFVFDKFAAGSTSENPRYQEANDRQGLGASESLFNMMMDMNDPRIKLFFADSTASFVAPNGTADDDPAKYTSIYDYITPDAPIEFMTYDELKFDAAEALFKMNNTDSAYSTMVTGVKACLVRQGVADVDDIAAYVSQAAFPTKANLTLDDINKQKYIAFYPMQSIEAYAEYRSAKYPDLVNPNGDIPRRMPYPNVELQNNKENVPDVTPSQGVWWDTGTE